MSVKHQDEENYIKGVPPTREDQFYIEWGRKTLKENISILNNMFKLFITLDTVLLSTYLGFFDKVLEDISPFSWQVISPAICILLSMTFSIIGISPFPISVSLVAPDEIKSYKARRSKCKNKCLGISAIALVCGFVILFIVRIVMVSSSSALQITLTPSP